VSVDYTMQQQVIYLSFTH